MTSRLYHQDCDFIIKEAEVITMASQGQRPTKNDFITYKFIRIRQLLIFSMYLSAYNQLQVNICKSSVYIKVTNLNIYTWFYIYTYRLYRRWKNVSFFFLCFFFCVCVFFFVLSFFLFLLIQSWLQTFQTEPDTTKIAFKKLTF